MIETTTVELAGTRLYYERRGRGPTLLLIPGGPTDAGAYDGIAAALADRYTVVAYDPRGNSRSVLTGPMPAEVVETYADDARRLLTALGCARAYVAGCGTGGTVGLELMASCPQLVRALVAHEPPVLSLLPDAPWWRDLTDGVYDTYRTDGVAAASRAFDRGLGLDVPEDKGGGGLSSTPNMDVYYAHVMKAVNTYTPDIDSLLSAPGRVVVAIGDDAGGKPADRAAAALAERLGTEPVAFPGGHVGFATHPTAFADALHRALRDN